MISAAENEGGHALPRRPHGQPPTGGEVISAVAFRQHADHGSKGRMRQPLFQSPQDVGPLAGLDADQTAGVETERGNPERIEFAFVKAAIGWQGPEHGPGPHACKPRQQAKAEAGARSEIAGGHRCDLMQGAG